MSSPQPSSSDEQITHLEMKLAYLEQDMETMSDVIHEQSKQINQLISALKITQQKVKELNDQGPKPFNPDNEIPPHY